MNNILENKLIGYENNIVFYTDEELEEESTCAKIAQVQKEGNRSKGTKNNNNEWMDRSD